MHAGNVTEDVDSGSICFGVEKVKGRDRSREDDDRSMIDCLLIL
jgi:hypothetical protein